jgi:hypothetical protein
MATGDKLPPAISEESTFDYLAERYTGEQLATGARRLAEGLGDGGPPDTKLLAVLTDGITKAQARKRKRDAMGGPISYENAADAAAGQAYRAVRGEPAPAAAKILKEDAQTNGTNGHTAPATNGTSGAPSATTNLADPAPTREIDPFVMRLFEGAGPQEIQLLASMYEARGLTDVARDLRERYAEWEKGQKQ